MSAEVHQFPKDRIGPRGSPGAGGAGAPPAVPTLEPGARVRLAYRWTWRGAYRLRSGDDVAPGYRMIVRAAAASLVQLLGPVEVAHYLMSLAAEFALCNGDNDDGPRAA